MCSLLWNIIWFYVVYKVCCFSFDGSIDNYVIVYWCVVLSSYDYNFVVTFSCCSSYTICRCWFEYKFDIIWVWSCCINSNICSIWPCWFRWIINSFDCIYSPISMATYAYSKLISYKTIFTYSRVCSATSLPGLLAFVQLLYLIVLPHMYPFYILPHLKSPQLEILSFATNHYATGMQLVIVCNYIGHVSNYKFGIV